MTRKLRACTWSMYMISHITFYGLLYVQKICPFSSCASSPLPDFWKVWIAHASFFCNPISRYCSNRLHPYGQHACQKHHQYYSRSYFPFHLDPFSFSLAPIISSWVILKIKERFFYFMKSRYFELFIHQKIRYTLGSFASHSNGYGSTVTECIKQNTYACMTLNMGGLRPWNYCC